MLYPPARHAEAAEGLLELSRTSLAGWFRWRRRRDALLAAGVHAQLAHLGSSAGPAPATPPTPPTPRTLQETVHMPSAIPPPARPRHARVAEPHWSDPTLGDHLASLTPEAILSGDPGELLAPPPVVQAAGGALPLFDYLRRLHPDSTSETGGNDRASNVLTDSVGAMYLAAAGAVVTVESGAQVPLATYFAGVDLAPGGELQSHFVRVLASVASRGVYRRDVMRLEGAHGHVMGRTTAGDPWPITRAVFDAVVAVLAGELGGRGIPGSTLEQLGTALIPVRTVLCPALPV